MSRNSRSNSVAAPSRAMNPPAASPGKRNQSDAELTRNLNDGIDDDAESLVEQELAGEIEDVLRARMENRGETYGLPDSSEMRKRMIAEAAYYKAERRAFQPGGHEQDWFEAEREIDAQTRQEDDGMALTGGSRTS